MFLRKCKFVNMAFLSTEQCVLNVYTFFVTRSIAGVKEALADDSSTMIHPSSRLFGITCESTRVMAQAWIVIREIRVEIGQSHLRKHRSGACSAGKQSARQREKKRNRINKIQF